MHYKNDYNFRFWQCGEVINTINGLKKSLENHKEKFKTFKSFVYLLYSIIFEAQLIV
mgnify:CR=1 FL=1